MLWSHIYIVRFAFFKHCSNRFVWIKSLGRDIFFILIAGMMKWNDDVEDEGRLAAAAHFVGTPPKSGRAVTLPPKWKWTQRKGSTVLRGGITRVLRVPSYNQVERRASDSDATKAALLLADAGDLGIGTFAEQDDADEGRQGTWKHAAFLLVANIIGTGVLELPAALKALGWIPGVITLILFYLLNTYTGKLLAEVQRYFPGAYTYGDVSQFYWGSRARVATELLLRTFWALALGSYVLVLSKTLAQIFGTVMTTCDLWWSVIGCGVLLGLNQLRTLYHISYLAIVSVVTIAGVVSMCLAVVVSDGRAPGTTTHIWWNDESSFSDKISALSTLVFAFMGQSLYLEIMSEMKDPTREFPIAINTAMPFMLAMYAGVGGTVYYFKGDNPKRAEDLSYLLNVLDGHGTGIIVAANVLMLIHMLVCYTITQQVLSRSIHVAMIPETADAKGTKATTHWFLITSGVMLFAWFMANAIPFFSQLTGIIGAIVGSPIALVLPPIFYIASLHANDAPIGGASSILLRSLMLLGIVLLTTGAYANINLTIEKAHDGGFGKPFACNATTPGS